MESWRLLAELVGLLSLALVLGLVAARLGQKAIIGYLVAGLVAGPRGLGIVKAAETVQFLAELGVALLLFSIGLEFSWHRIAAFGRKVVVGGLLQFGLTWTCGFAVGHFAGLTPAGSVALGRGGSWWSPYDRRHGPGDYSEQQGQRLREAVPNSNELSV